MANRITPFGETVVSWRTVWDYLGPRDADEPHYDTAAAGMHRLRGLIMTQCAETEAVLRMIVERLEPMVNVERRSAGQLLRDTQRLVDGSEAECAADLAMIDQAIKSRNRAVHSPVTIGSTWAPYETGGGEWIPAISLMSDDEYDEADLLRDFVLQQQGTIAAVRLLRVVIAEE